MNENEEELRTIIIEASCALSRAYYTDLSKEQLIIEVRRISVDLMEVTEEI